MITLLRTTVLASLILALFSSCTHNTETSDASLTSSKPTENAKEVSIEFEKYTLDNGLDVILHVDRSDPIVAINLAAHVGSSRETAGKTGFAHLFEHLLFLDSENLGYGGLDEMNTRIGGEGTNGFTTNDLTQYFQTVPADALEKVIWAEADKLGYFINTVTQPVIDNEKQVVKNEKRQGVDNRPYGHRGHIIAQSLYPKGHPYNWTVIGSLDDLQSATLEDVKNFYTRWYVPNNVTLTLTGDFDVVEAKQLIEKYFGEIPRGPEVRDQVVAPPSLSASKSLYHEDNFATVPQLALVWPTVELGHPDAFAIDVLSELLSQGKRAPLNEVLIDEQKLTSDLYTFSWNKELAGEFYLVVNANADTDLDQVMTAVDQAFERFEKRGIQQADIDRIKTEQEVKYYSSLEGILGKSISLAQFNTLSNDPNRINTDIDRLKAVSIDDVLKVYQRYLKGRPFVATSFVPKGQVELALSGSTKADIVEEKIVSDTDDAPVDFDPKLRNFARTTSNFDRSKEPDFGAPISPSSPAVWQRTLSNGLEIYGIENNETPLVAFSMSIDAGRSRNQIAKPALANLTADMLKTGTQDKTNAELEDAIKSLGSTITVTANEFDTTVTGQTLARNFAETMSLLEEILLTPRWDSEEFALLIRKQQSQIDQDAGDPDAILRRELAKIEYPSDHVFSYRPYGTKAKLATVTLDDLKAFHQRYYAPANSRLRVVGNISPEVVADALASLQENWDTPTPPPVRLPPATAVNDSKLYFYDVPGAKQSVIRIKRPSLAATDPQYPLAQAANFLLGNIYTSRLMTELRVNKGYTYGIGSRFDGDADRGAFFIATSVRSNVTLESLKLIRQIVDSYGPNFSDQDLEILKGALLRGQALKTETLNAKLAVLANISDYDYDDDYQAQHAEQINAMSLTDFKKIADQYFRIDAMNYLVVGDAETQLKRLEELGLGEPILLNP